MKKKTLVSLIVFLLGMCLVGLIVYKTDAIEKEQKRTTAQLNATAYGERIKNEITNGIEVTDTLQQILISENGEMNYFDTISKNIIDFMGGKIDVYSEKGKGSAFVVTVPLKTAKEDRRRTERTTYQEYDFSGKRVLLVEDNEINIEITRNILIHKNFMVDIAENGKAGVEQFLKHEPGYYDVILMDIRMPVMDGLAATRCIRESDHADSKTVPIVAMTANVFEEDVKKSFDAGMNAHLSKPVDIKQMYAVLDELVTGDGLL